MDLRYRTSSIIKIFMAAGVFSVFAFAGADEYQANYRNQSYDHQNHDHQYNDHQYEDHYISGGQDYSHYAPCSANSCCGTPCNEPPACDWGYNPPAYARCGCENSNGSFFNNVTARFDFLWWRANEEGLELGTEEFVDSFTGSSTPVRNTVVNVSHAKKPNFKYDPGFRIGLMNHCACDCYDVALNWTHFHSKANVRGASEGDTEFFSEWERIADALPTVSRGRYSLNLDLLDLELGRKFYVSSCFVLRPFAGLRGARIDQNYRVASFSDREPEDDRLNNFTSDVKSRSDFMAIGPRLGLDLEVHLGCGLIVFGQAAGSIVFGTFDNHSKERFHDFVTVDAASIGDINYEAKSSSHRTSRTFTDFAIGLKWEHCYEWCNRMHPISLAFAWEHHAFYNMNNFNFGSNGLELIESDSGVFAVPVGNSLPRKHGDLYTQGLTISASFGF